MIMLICLELFIGWAPKICSDHVPPAVIFTLLLLDYNHEDQDNSPLILLCMFGLHPTCIGFN